MSGRPALDVASGPRVLVRDGERTHEVFVIIAITDQIVRARSPLLFEVGEELALRIEQNGTTTDVRARVRAHVGPPDARETELEILASSV